MSSGPINPLAFASVHGRNDVSLTDRSFLQALTGNDYHNPKQDNNMAIYVHPLVKKSSAKLSDKSLEMCTESLGSETGSDDIMEETMIGYYSSTIHSKENKISTKAKHGEYNFPPPLSSISESVSVKAHRENGRLVMNTVVLKDSSNSSMFLAERINGSLRLQFKKRDLEEVEDEFDETNGEGRETEDSVSVDKGMNENMESMEGSTGSDENISGVERCNEAGVERRGERGHIWNVKTCFVAT